MSKTEELKRELQVLSDALVEYVGTNMERMTSKGALMHNLRDVGFTSVGESKFALNLKYHNKTYVSFLLSFRNGSVDITEDHIIVVDGKEEPLSSVRKPFTLIGVRYSKVIESLLNRVKELTELFKEGAIDE